jgi:hypothetical protein
LLLNRRALRLAQVALFEGFAGEQSVSLGDMARRLIWRDCEVLKAIAARSAAA